MDAALYHPEFGYYARAVQRSGRAGDFFTSVDVGPLFGELLTKQIAEMAQCIGRGRPLGRPASFDLVEAGAGNGRLSADILHALKHDSPDIYHATKLHLIDNITVYENGATLPPSRILYARVSLASDRSFTSYEQARAHVEAPRLSHDLELYIAWDIRRL